MNSTNWLLTKIAKRFDAALNYIAAIAGDLVDERNQPEAWLQNVLPFATIFLHEKEAKRNH